MRFLLCLLLYAGLAQRSPLEWSQPVWFVLGFLIIPALMGWLSVSKGLPKTATSGFRAGMWNVGIAMFLYALYQITKSYYRLGNEGDGGSRLTIGWIVAFVYALLAGAVAGLVGAWRAQRIAQNPPESGLPAEEAPVEAAPVKKKVRVRKNAKAAEDAL